MSELDAITGANAINFVNNINNKNRIFLLFNKDKVYLITELKCKFSSSLFSSFVKICIIIVINITEPPIRYA